MPVLLYSEISKFVVILKKYGINAEQTFSIHTAVEKLHETTMKATNYRHEKLKQATSRLQHRIHKKLTTGAYA